MNPTVHVEWGLAGARALAPDVDVLIVVDVLSFSTAVEVAASRGAVVFPFGVRDAAAARAFAAQMGAQLAVSRQQMTTEAPFSLSPPSLLGLEPAMRLVLPSPNGSAISVEATRQHRRVLAGCLRNAAAVARSAQHIGQRIGLVAAGEHWPSVEQPDRAFRVALEDLLGAGAIVRSLAAARSPEAEVAVAAFERAAGDLAGYLRGCTSGRELIGLGFQQDVEMAAELDVSQTVPRFVDGAYVAETS